MLTNFRSKLKRLGAAVLALGLGLIVASSAMAQVTPSSATGNSVLLADGATVQNFDDQVRNVSYTFTAPDQLQVSYEWFPADSGSFTWTSGIHTKLFFYNGSSWSEIYSRVVTPPTITGMLNSWQSESVSFTLPATTDGIKYFRASIIDLANSTDRMTGNFGCASCGTASASGRHYDNADVAFTVDTTAPTTTAVTIASNNTDPTVAANGDTITLSMTFSENLASAPTVNLIGQSVTATGSGANWTATATVDGATATGAAAFTISNYQDPAGNVGSSVTTTSNGSEVIVDNVAPTVTIASLASDNADPALATVGDTITLTMEFSEPLGAAPSVTLIGQTVTATGADANWTASAVVDGTTALGAASFTISSYEDVPGNPGTSVTATTDSSEVIVDTVLPTVTVASLVSNNADPTLATVGDTVTLTMQFSEDLQAAPTIVLLGQSVTATGSGTDWSASAVVAGDTPQGPATFTISAYQDAAGNTGEDVSAVTDASSVTIDSVNPALVISGVPTDFTAGDVFNVTFDFGEEVTGFTTDDIVVTGAAKGPLTGGPSSYSMEITPDASGDVTVEVADAAANDLAGNPSTAASATSALRSAEAASEAISEFLLNRGRSIIQHQPRLLGYLNGSGSGSMTATVSRDGNALLSFGSGMDKPVWFTLEASQTAHADETETVFALAALGGHLTVNDGLLVGAMLQLDYAEDTTEGGATVTGQGWMAGPYVLGQFGDQPLFYEARALWGTSQNEISPFGTFSDEFKTERFLAMAAVEGRYDAETYRVFPRMQLSHFQDKQLAYTDSIDNVVPEQTVAITELSTGLNFEMPMSSEYGEHLLTWGGSGTLSVLDAEGASEEYLDSYQNGRLRAEAGYQFTSDSGLVFSGDAFVDGIGKEAFTTVGLGLSVEMTF